MSETQHTVRNRSLKMSPGGVITLPVSARKTLGMTRQHGVRVTIAVKERSLLLRPASDQAGTASLAQRPDGACWFGPRNLSERRKETLLGAA